MIAPHLHAVRFKTADGRNLAPICNYYAPSISMKYYRFSTSGILVGSYSSAFERRPRAAPLEVQTLTSSHLPSAALAFPHMSTSRTQLPGEWVLKPKKQVGSAVIVPFCFDRAFIHKARCFSYLHGFRLLDLQFFFGSPRRSNMKST